MFVRHVYFFTCFKTDGKGLIDIKLGIIGGAGLLGSTTAFYAAAGGLVSEIVLSDVKENLAICHATDIEQAVCGMNDVKLSVAEIDGLRDCEIILNTAGIPEMKVQSRDAYLGGNIVVVRELAKKIGEWGTAPIIVTATNPVDVINYSLFELSGLPKEKFVGFSSNDATRFKWAASSELGIPARLLDALVIGEHGDNQVPLFGTLARRDSGEPVTLGAAQRESILHRIKNFFAEGQRLNAGRSSGWTSGVGICDILRMIVTDSDEIRPCSVIPDGQYGLKSLSIGLPVRLGRTGVREIVEIGLSDEERDGLYGAAEKIKRLIDSTKGTKDV